jgi:hypothetical protein
LTRMEDKLGILEGRIIDFRNRRDWKQFHNPKDVPFSLILEATEVLEHFQWKITIRSKNIKFDLINWWFSVEVPHLSKRVLSSGVC